MWIKFNENPQGKQVGDCVIRAVSKALNQSWEETYIDLALQGLLMGDMPSANAVWGAYLKSKGFERSVIPNTCPDCYTVRDFCNDNQDGVYILGIGTHTVTVIDGVINIFDELLEIIKLSNPNLYTGVLQNLSELD